MKRAKPMTRNQKKLAAAIKAKGEITVPYLTEDHQNLIRAQILRWDMNTNTLKYVGPND